MALARRIAYNVVVNTAVKATSTVVLSLLLIRLITGYLGQDGFGKYATVLAFFSFFMALGDLGLGPVTAREISKENAKESEIVGKVLALRLLASSLILLIAPIIFFFAYPTEVEMGVLIIALASLFSSTSQVLNGVFQKRLLMDRVAMTEFIGKVIQVSLIGLAVKFNLGFLFIVFSVLIALSFNAVVVFALARKLVRFSLRFDRAFLGAFLKESLPMGATALITFAYLKTDTILLSMMQSSAEVGIYNVAFKIIENLVFLPALLAGLILPILSRFSHEREYFVDIANKTFKVFLLLVVPAIIATLFLAPQIIAIVSGGGFEASNNVLRILVLSLGLIFFGHFFNMLLIVSGHQKKLMQALIVAALFNITLNFLLIERYTYIGSAVASVLTESLVVLLAGALTWRLVRYHPRDVGFGRIFVSGALMAAVLFLFHGTPFLVSVLAAVCSYGGALYITRAVSRSEITALFSRSNESPVEVPLS